jgi:deoxyribose-phosphate aldolase
MPQPLPPWLVPFAERPLGALIDHTLLRPEASEREILRLCDEAVELGLGAVCVNGQWVSVCAARLRGTAVRVVAVAGFPLGASGLVAKSVEARLAVADGAHEVDVVASLGMLRSGRWDAVQDELAAVVQAVRGRAVKAILETAALEPREIAPACRAAREAGARWVKTSTGFHPAGGATEAAVASLRREVGGAMGVKASGGIREVDAALAMLRAGADRLGTSAAAGWGPALRVPVGRLLEQAPAAG